MKAASASPASARERQRQIGPVLFEQMIVAVGCDMRVDQRRQGVDIEFDRGRGVGRCREGLGNDDGERLAGITDLVDRDDRLIEPRQGGERLHA